ncbi:MAG: hypothetical protein LBI14_08055 [Treponema sp.]|jgi:hypothetical protein|nr:hypothetical protein [Treponema sp.]
MKKLIFFVLILFALSYSVFAQFHFDVNVGGGFSAHKNTVADEYDHVRDWNTAPFLTLGAGIGYAPFGFPLYIVGEYKNYNFNSHFVGAGVIYYPFSNKFLQLGSSLGYVSGRSDGDGKWQPINGFMLNVSVALSLLFPEISYLGVRYSLRLDGKMIHMFGLFVSIQGEF